MTVPFHPCDWSLPPGVAAGFTLCGAQGSWNLGWTRDATGGPAVAAPAAREQLREALGVERIEFLDQRHGTAVHRVAAVVEAVPVADGVVCSREGIACAVLTADCLPVLYASADGEVVAAAHAGWRGLSEGILESTLAAMGCAPNSVHAWLGAAIGPRSFEVGPEVRAAFLRAHGTRASVAALSRCFMPGRDDRWFADLYGLARLRLAACGVASVSGGGADTFTESGRFHSFRRDGAQAGRQATLIWKAAVSPA